MAEESLKNKTVKGTVWSSIERFSVQGVQFIVMIFMARILTPDDYGIVGMLSIFIAVSQAIVDSGFSQALIRKLDRNQVDNSTVFYFNVGVSILLYFILFFCAVPISKFYNEPILIPVTRLLALIIPINSFSVVQRALLTVNLDFKTQATASLIAAFCTGAVGLSLAYTGFGVWAIVWSWITSAFINNLLLWFLTHWHPILAYSWASFHSLFNFGSKLLASGIIDTLYNNTYTIVIGKVFKASDLGFFTRANQFSNLASENITGIFHRVSYPVLCTIQDDDQRLAEVYRKMLKTSAFVIFPLMIGMASVAKPMIVSILSEKWLYTAVLLVPICLGGMWYPVHAINLNLLQVKGRSDLFLKLEIIKKLLGVGIIVGSIPLGLYWMCWGTVLSSLLALVINTYYTGKLISLGFFKQMWDLFPILILSLTMGCASWSLVTYVPMHSGAALAAGIGVGFIYYVSMSKIFKFPEYNELLGMVMSFINKRSK